MIKYFLSLCFLLSTSTVFASGPSDREVWQYAYGKTYKMTWDAGCKRAKEKARGWAEYVTEEQEGPDKDGWIVDTRECTEETKESNCECKKRGKTSDKLRCFYEAKFKCTEIIWHEDQ